MTSYENSKLLWHYFNELKTHLAISKQNRSTNESKSLTTIKILEKHSTELNLLNGSGWLELDSILLNKDFIFEGLS